MTPVILMTSSAVFFVLALSVIIFNFLGFFDFAEKVNIKAWDIERSSPDQLRASFLKQSKSFGIRTAFVGVSVVTANLSAVCFIAGLAWFIIDKIVNK